MSHPDIEAIGLEPAIIYRKLSDHLPLTLTFHAAVIQLLRAAKEGDRGQYIKRG